VSGNDSSSSSSSHCDMATCIVLPDVLLTYQSYSAGP
jgi:hypothetical protein